MKHTILFFTIVTTALMAGLFFSWSVSVMPGLKRLSDREFVLAMQAMNRAIINPVFLACFMGAGVLLAVSCFLQFEKPVPPTYYWLLAASLIYLIGVLGVTFLGNIPLNNALDALNAETTGESALSTFRQQFELNWTALNHIRTISSLVSLCMLLGMFFKK